MVYNSQRIGLLLLIVTNTARVKTDELLVQYLEDTVSQGMEAAKTYEPPQDAYQYKASNRTPTDYGTFDYVIVGAGAAGAVLATRLSEDQYVTILLIEAGGRATTFVNIAGMFAYLQRSEFNWNFPSTPQPNSCLGMVNHQCLHPRGKGLGGSTLINGLVYSRGNKYNYDSWATAGNAGWSYKDVLPYFKKSENLQNPGDGDSFYHGKGGLLNVEYQKPLGVVDTHFIKANQELGIKSVDYNGKNELGVSVPQQNLINGRRQHTAKAFLEKGENRPNLRILTDSYATKVEIDKNKQARSVLFDHNGQAFRANARKEVILSAGSYGSPQLLMLSGIGPTAQLKSFNIPVIQNLPVGENHWDHVTFWSVYFRSNATTPNRTLNENVRDYINGYGPFTFQGIDVISFIRTKSSSTPQNVPNIELLLQGPEGITALELKNLNFDNETFNTIWGQIDKQRIFKIAVTLLKPQSLGTVRLKSSSPYDYPLVNPNFLSDRKGEDIQGLYEGIMEAIKLTNTSAFKEIDVTLVYNVLPSCQNYTYFSKEQWFCQIRHLTSNLYHPAGTCKMGRLSNGGVVDNQLRVHGIKNLRVVDASVIPEAIAGHTSAPSTMIAEKIADLLKSKRK